MAEALLQTQTAFAEFLLAAEPQTPEVLRARFTGHLDAGLRVYRNNVMYSLSQALAAGFPVVHRLVGQEFFGALARDYIRLEPPRTPSLTYYGHLFPDFIGNHDACKPLPYLADVATVEYLCQRALHAADAALLETAELAAVPPEQVGSARLGMHPSARLFDSPWPVARIWHAHQDENPEPIHLDAEQPAWLLVYRRGFQVQVLALQPAVYVLLQSLGQGLTLEAAWARVQAEQGSADDELPSMLGYLLSLGVFSTLQLAQTGEAPA